MGDDESLRHAAWQNLADAVRKDMIVMGVDWAGGGRTDIQVYWPAVETIPLPKPKLRLIQGGKA